MRIDKNKEFIDIYNLLMSNKDNIEITDDYLSNISILYSLFLLDYDLSSMVHRIKSPICYELLIKLGIIKSNMIPNSLLSYYESA